MSTLKPQNKGPLYSNMVVGTLAVDKWAVIYIFIHHQDGSTVDIRRLNKIYNLTKKQRMKQSSPNAHAMRYTNRLA